MKSSGNAVKADNARIEQEKVEEMKVLKFKTMINDIYKQLGGTTKSLGPYSTHPVKVLLNVEKEDPFINCIVNLQASGKFLSSCGSALESNMEGVIGTARHCSTQCSIGEKCSAAGQTIFFALMGLAIDKDLYEEKIEIVSDAAYLMGFTEDMIEDWVSAVKHVLLAEKINSAAMKTEEARHFFFMVR